MPPEDLARARRWLYQQKCLGVESTPPEHERIHVRAYFPSRKKVEPLRRSLAQAFPEVESFQSTTIGLTWDREVGADFIPFPLTERVWVFPATQTVPVSEVETQERIYLKPFATFGSGRHETTQLMVQLMTMLGPRPASLLDVGSGTGILAILAKKLGIDQVDAVEISADARRAAERNFRLNDLGDIGMYRDLKRVTGNYEVLLANLLTPTILELKKEILSHLRTGGCLLLSGITAGEAEEVRQAFRRLRLEKQIQKGEWVGMILRDTHL